MEQRKLIFIAYYFFPNKEVAANRIRFWVTYLLHDYPEIIPVVVTATQFKDEEKLVENQYHVDIGRSGLSGIVIKDKGINWRRPLKQFFRKNQFSNVLGVVITGGPFMHFSVVPELKKVLKCKVAIDFRDPFSDNQRFNNSPLKVMIKSYFERKFVENSDFVISVNNSYFDTMAGYKPDKSKFHVIPNGFDEITIDKALTKCNTKERPGNVKKLILTGKYYKDALPYSTFAAIKELRNEGVEFEFAHYGGSEIVMDDDEKVSYIIEKGITDYTEIAEALVLSDIGVVITPGIDQNTPTKVFDYIGAELPILIITNGELISGNLHEVTKNYPIVKWCRNNKKEIKASLLELYRSDLNVKFANRLDFSRRKGLKSLIDILSA